jgi:hypothetical protein
VDQRDVLPAGDDGPDEVTVLSGELAGVNTELGDAVAWMEENGFSPAIAKRVTALEAKKRDLTARLGNARAQAARPAEEAWGSVGSLIDVLDSAPDPTDARLRLRSALRRVVEEIRLLIVPRGRYRLAAVTVAFSGSDRLRNYLIFYRPPFGNHTAKRTPARWAVLSSSSDDLLAFSFTDWDLRNRSLVVRKDGSGTAGVEEMAEFLDAYPKDMIDRLLRKGHTV